MPHLLKLEKTNEGSTRCDICPTPLKLEKNIITALQNEAYVSPLKT